MKLKPNHVYYSQLLDTIYITAHKEEVAIQLFQDYDYSFFYSTGMSSNDMLLYCMDELYFIELGEL